MYFQGPRGFCHYKVLGIDHAVAVVGAVHYVKESGRSQSNPSPRTHVENEIHSGKSTRAQIRHIGGATRRGVGQSENMRLSMVF